MGTNSKREASKELMGIKHERRGRPTVPPEDSAIVQAFTLYREHIEWLKTQRNKSEAIRRLIERAMKEGD